MTVSIPESGLRARVQRAARGTAVFAIAVGLCGFSAVGRPAPALAAEEDAPQVEIHLTTGGNGTVLPGLSTSATVTVRNDTDSALSAGRVDVELNRTALTDQAAVTAWLESGDAEGEFASIAADDTARVDATSSGTTSMVISPESLAGLAPGVYAVRAALEGASTGATTDERISRNTSTSSVLVIAGEQRPQVTVFVPITATPDDGALLTSDELTELTAADGDLTAQLDGVAGTAAVLAIDPAIVAAIRVLGTSAPSTAVDWLQRLEELPNERFALQFGDADATTQAQADLPGLLTPTTLAPYLDAADFTSLPQPTDTPDAEFTPSPSPTMTPGEVLLPDDAALTHIDAAASGILWPRSEVTVDDLADFRAYLGGESTTLLSSTSVSGAVGHASIGEQDVLVTDAAASDALSDAAAESDAAARSESLAAANAHLFLTAQSSPGTMIAVGLDRDEDRTSDALRAAVGTVDSTGVDLSALRSAPAAPASLVETTADERGSSLQLLLGDEAALGSFATILDDPQVLLSPERIRILRTIRVGRGDSQFDEKVAEHRQETRATLDAVHIPESSTIQLLSANADLPFSIRNELPWPVNVNLTVSPSDPRLEVQSVTPAQIPGNTTTRVKVPVSARVGSGELNLRLSLSSPTGIGIAQDQTVRVAVRAEWENIGLAIFGSLIVVLLVLGVLRTVHRKRREKADAVHEADTDGADGAGDPAGEKDTL